MSGDPFSLVWLGVVALMGTVSLFGAIIDLKRGSAEFILRGPIWGPPEETWVWRDEEPFEFWVTVGMKLAVFALASFMFCSGLGMVKW
ncbi:hypothetical protein OF829_17625 [Sphingomonas sp. LB-2]|uniref:hypothetical protein n=1 Tax=Sphingomonas caeni TaxID=2984949 RepID=UPI00222E5CAA|nr:hypothetical protein [Sphingomonas caeni]MCW3849062.1 hypothetical protein [Sphingomonas caeni]